MALWRAAPRTDRHVGRSELEINSGIKPRKSFVLMVLLAELQPSSGRTGGKHR
jgi:hypothetical protein